MNITVPVYIEQLVESADSSSVYAVRPLFFREPEARDEQLGRALAKFTRELRRELDHLGREMRHDRLAAYSFAPELEDHLQTFTLDLGDRTARCCFLLVTLEGLGRKLAFTPSLPNLWFEIERGETLHSRATEVLTRYFRGKERKGEDPVPKPEDLSVGKRAWASSVEIDIHPPQVTVAKPEERFALLGGGEVLDGEGELHRVGRCLDWLYPGELHRVVCREREVEELTRLLRAPDRRPVLVAGPRQVGKTALIEEYVYRVVSRRRSPYVSKNNVWLIARPRLISGMSYVGQWENRLLAILKEARERDHILYFDDLLGLFKAGLTRDSALSVAHVMRPYLERREFRMLGEITPEAWRVLREVDRGFADLFQLLPVPEPGEDETLEMLISLTRQLEQQHRCRFSLDALPAALDLQRRYVRDAAFPGKAAAFLRQLAVKYRHQDIRRQNVLDEFHAKSGLAVSFLDRGAKLARQEVIAALSREVIGQGAALEAAADVVCVAKARLNDPDRPLASFLFLGPTGVGKTHCAKALAAYLFGDAERLVRFDMNEFISPASVARLVGTFDQPEGLLTSAVRRQPFAVVLLDEIEKAHRDVFNLLLQVMGDGRLTDALGRTADFTNTIVILTSNLGVKEAGSGLGFWPQRSQEASVYRQAAEKFFSPEFFNRLDRIVPFNRLGREEVRRLAHKLIQDVFAREGLKRRKCVLQVDERALEKIVDEGYHPQLGARALKRAIERQLAQPVAARLAAMEGATPTIVSLYPSRQGLAVQVQALTQIEPQGGLPSAAWRTDPGAALGRIEAVLNRVDERVARLRPEGPISVDEVRPEHHRYFALREQIRFLQRSCHHLANRLARPKRATLTTTHYRGAKRRPAELKQMRGWARGARQFWKQLFAAQDIHAYLQELATDHQPQPESELVVWPDGDYTWADLPNELTEVLRETALLEAMTQNLESAASERALILIRSLDASGEPQRERLSSYYQSLFDYRLGVETQAVNEAGAASCPHASWLVAQGYQVWPLLDYEQGTHLFLERHETLAPIQVKLFALGAQEDAGSVIERLLGERQRWLELLAAGEAAGDDDPFRLGPVVRIYDGQGAAVDLRSGLVARRFSPRADLRAFLLSALPWPPEFANDDR